MNKKILPLQVKPIIKYPSQAIAGDTYLMTVDLEVDEDFSWEYEEEEYPVYCSVESNVFKIKNVGEPTILLHRFGGSYGAIKFLLTAQEVLEIRPDGEIKVGFINSWGIGVKVLKVANITVSKSTTLEADENDGKVVKRQAKDELLTSYKAKNIEQSQVVSNPLPKVFISYDHDSQVSIDKELELSDRLRNNSIVNNLPSRRYPSFVGRKKEIKQLLERISFNLNQHIIVIYGIGGIGKTSLAIEVAYQIIESSEKAPENIEPPVFETIIFASSKATDIVDTMFVNRPEKESTLSDIFRLIAKVLKKPTITKVSEEEQLTQVNIALSKQRTLLIVDNLETVEYRDRQKILEFLNNVPNTTKVIITTRESIGFATIKIEQLTEQESFRLIDIQAQAKGIEVTRQQKRQIYKRFSGIPVALIYVIGQSAAGYKFADILKQTVNLPEDLGKFCFETSVAPLRGKAEHKLLLAMTFFFDSALKDAAIGVAGLNPRLQMTSDAIANLKRLSLIAEEDGYYQMLSMTREYMLNEFESHISSKEQEEMRERWLNWYFEFVKKFGDEDWENWRTKYDRIEREWQNITSVLSWYRNNEQWHEVVKFWEQLDGYVELNGYWHKRCHWWKLIANKVGDTETRIKANSEGASTLILRGRVHYGEAEQCLQKAWQQRKQASPIVSADIANHFALLEKGRQNYQKAIEWLETESQILTGSNLEERQLTRHQAQNLFYRAEISYVTGEQELAKQQFESVVELCERVKWQRFRNYAQNALAEIAIDKGDLETAEDLILEGSSFAEISREKRRIALYQASYAKLYARRASQVAEADESFGEYMLKAQQYANLASEVFQEELMVVEEERIQQLLNNIEELVNA
jgi:DNA replication protein DnaC